PAVMSAALLAQIAEALSRGTLAIVDLTQPLGPATPVIGLPEIFAASPGVTIDVISRYDENGPAWYWNALTFGEHTGTHFDAPVPNHTIMHGAGKFGLASLCHLDRLPPTGAIVIAAPLKIVNGSGSPLRVLAIIPAR